MINSIRSVMSPLLIISYVCGLRIVEFPVGYLGIWFSFLYMLMFWAIYCILFRYTVLFHPINMTYSVEQRLIRSIEIFTTLLSILFGMYYNKKFRNCLKKLNIVDDTLLKLGTTTNYYKLHKRTRRFVVGWFVAVILTNCGTAINFKVHSDIMTAIYIFSVQNYCFHINAISDLIIASILAYLGLKFDQVNEQLQSLMIHNKRDIKRAWENSVLNSHQLKSLKSPNGKHLTWLVIHLHLELCKISREIDLIFGAEMTFKMGSYFACLSMDLHEIFYVMLTNNYIEYETLFTITNLFWLSHNVSKLFFINYICETVSAKARTTGDLINKMSYSHFDVEVRENISQLLLQITQAPLRFCGIGLFQFGLKFLQGFCTSVATVVVLLLQAHTEK